MTLTAKTIEAAKAAIGLPSTGGIPGLLVDLSRIQPRSSILTRLAAEPPQSEGEPVESSSGEVDRSLPSPREAVLVLSREIANRILSNTVSPLDGAEIIHAISIEVAGEYPELGTFLFAALEAPDRPEDRADFEKAILEEAHALVTHS